VTDSCSTSGGNSCGTCDSGFAQDQGSLLTPSGGPLILAFETGPSTIAEEARTVLNVTTEGGVGAVRYVYTGLPDGRATASTTSLACAPPVIDNFTVTVRANDSAGHSATANATLRVTAPPSGPPSASYLWLDVVIGAVAGGAVAWLLVVRRKRPPL